MHECMSSDGHSSTLAIGVSRQQLSDMHLRAHVHISILLCERVIKTVYFTTNMYTVMRLPTLPRPKNMRRSGIL